MMTKKELRKISLQYRTFASQMLKIDSEEEKVHIKAFFDFITGTPFIHDYIEKCHREDYSFEDVFSHRRYNEVLILPSDQVDLVDYGYQLINCILESNRSLFIYGQPYTSSNKFADMISAFMRKVVEPFVVALRSYLELSLIDAADSEEASTTSSAINVFLSYCQKDSEIADLIDNGLRDKLDESIHISRDIRDVAYHESFKQFMQTIQDHDYVIILISDRYLKSRNCMFEVTETVKDSKYQSRLIFVVIQDNDKKYLSDPGVDSIAGDVYSIDGQTKYIVFWKEKEDALQQQIDQIGDPISAINQIKEMKVVKRIRLDLPDFLEFIRDNNAYPLSRHLEEGFSSMCRYMNIET